MYIVGGRMTPINIAEILKQQGPSKWLQIAVFAIAVGVVLFCFVQVESTDKQETDIDADEKEPDVETDHYSKPETDITNMFFLVIMFSVSMPIILVIIVGNFI